jgi:hypothetical protein
MDGPQISARTFIDRLLEMFRPNFSSVYETASYAARVKLIQSTSQSGELLSSTSIARRTNLSVGHLQESRRR